MNWLPQTVSSVESLALAIMCLAVRLSIPVDQDPIEGRISSYCGVASALLVGLAIGVWFI